MTPRGASVNNFFVGVIPGRGGGFRAQDKTKILRGKRENNHVPISKGTLERFGTEFLKVALPKRNEDGLREVERRGPTYRDRF